MKKLILASLLVALAATSSFGEDAADSDSVVADAGKTIVSGTSTIGKLSTGVHMAWNTDAAGYAIITAHKSGVKQFGRGHDSTAILWNVYVPAAVITAPGSASAGSVTGDGWTSL